MTFRLDTRRPRAASWAAISSILFAVFLLRAGTGRAEELPRVVLAAPAEAELTARILGQTQDLGATIALSAGDAPADAAAATSLGRAQGAAIVVWTEARGGADLELHVLEVETGELRTRSVSTPEKEALASSTTAEMAALVVRSELSALLAEIKAEKEQKAAELAKAAAVVVPSAATATENKPEAAPVTAQPAPLPWTLTLGYRPSYPVKDEFAHGLSLGLRRDIAGFAFGFSAVGSLPMTLAEAGTQIRLTRLQLRLEALKPWQVLADLRLSLGLAASLGLDFRRTSAVVDPMIATDDAVTLTGGFGLFGQLEWAFSRHVGIALALGADVVPWRTTFVYDSEQGGGVVARLSWLDAWALVGLFTRF